MLTLFHEHIIRLRIAYYQWALECIDPLHPDVPEIVRRIYGLQLRLMDLRKKLQA